MREVVSVLAFGSMVAGLAGLYYAHALFTANAAVIAIQGAAVALMIAARITFGRRSFHAAANPTAGGIVTSGPYRYIRHPIYAAVLYFTCASALAHSSPTSIAWVAVITAGAFTRMLLEERMLVERYPEYREYKARVKRIVPYVF